LSHCVYADEKKFLKSLKSTNQIGITRSEAIKIELEIFLWNKKKIKKKKKMEEISSKNGYNQRP
jgi:hypothetical protein